jgi:hypothetical protein
MLRRLLVIVAATTFVVGAAVPAASADPVKAKNATMVHATCGTSSVNVVVNGNGVFAPAHVIGSTSVFIPTAFNLTFTFTPTGGSAMVEHETSTKAAAIKNTVTCTIPLQTLFSGPQGTGTLQGTVTGFFTPRG